MPYFGRVSLSRLEDLHKDLQRVLRGAIQHFDFTIIWGYRDEDAQNAAYKAGKSKKKWPHSKHNQLPSMAVDIAPWPLVYDAHPIDFGVLAGVILYCAWERHVEIRWGGDWNKNLTVNDETFKDLGHFELLHPS